MLHLLTFVDHSSHHHSSSVKRSWVSVREVELVLYLKKNGTFFAEEKKMVGYMQLKFVSLGLSIYRNVVREARGSDLGESIVIHAPHTG